VLFCGREHHHSLYGGSADITQIGHAPNFSHDFRDSEPLTLRSLNFSSCFVTVPREALLAVLRSLRQMLADKGTTKQKKRAQRRRQKTTVFSFVVFLKSLSDYIASNDWLAVKDVGVVMA
jgi:hypothetical protein